LGIQRKQQGNAYGKGAVAMPDGNGNENENGYVNGNGSSTGKMEFVSLAGHTNNCVYHWQ